MVPINWIGLQALVTKELRRMRRVWIQTLVTPWISALLYIFVFGYVVGSRINLIAGVRYIDFVLPGIVMMNIIGSSFAQSSTSVYFQRFTKNIEELLVAPFSYLEMVVSYVLGGVLRGMIVGLGIYIIALLFTTASISHVGLFVFYVIAVSAIFSLLGILVGLWSESFEHLTILNTFVITPLSFLGGVFNSIHMLPEKFQLVARLNPFFYFVDGLRHAMIGINEANAFVGITIIAGCVALFGTLTWALFSRGYKLRI